MSNQVHKTRPGRWREPPPLHSTPLHSTPLHSFHWTRGSRSRSRRNRRSRSRRSRRRGAGARTLSKVDVLVLIPELKGLVDAGGGARGNSSPEEPLVSGEIHLNSRVAAAVVDVASVDLLDSHYWIWCRCKNKMEGKDERSSSSRIKEAAAAAAAAAGAGAAGER